MAATRTISGARAKLFLGDEEIGHAINVSGSETQMLQRVDVLGDIYSKEIIPMRRVVQFSASHVRIYKGSLKALGAMARGDTTAVLSFPPMTAVLYDTVEDDAIETITGCVAETRSWSVDAAGILNEQVSFQALKMKDEDEE